MNVWCKGCAEKAPPMQDRAAYKCYTCKQEVSVLQLLGSAGDELHEIRTYWDFQPYLSKPLHPPAANKPRDKSLEGAVSLLNPLAGALTPA